MAALMGDTSNLLVWPALEIRNTLTQFEESMWVSGICLDEAQLQRQGKACPLHARTGGRRV